jgi:hypothetical protein
VTSAGQPGTIAATSIPAQVVPIQAAPAGQSTTTPGTGIPVPVAAVQGGIAAIPMQVLIRALTDAEIREIKSDLADQDKQLQTDRLSLHERRGELLAIARESVAEKKGIRPEFLDARDLGDTRRWVNEITRASAGTSSVIRVTNAGPITSISGTSASTAPILPARDVPLISGQTTDMSWYPSSSQIIATPQLPSKSLPVR